MKKVKPVVDTRLRPVPVKKKGLLDADRKEYVLDAKPKPLTLGNSFFGKSVLY